jgi:hypothetical protein
MNQKTFPQTKWMPYHAWCLARAVIMNWDTKTP